MTDLRRWDDGGTATYGVDWQEEFPFRTLYMNEFVGNGLVIDLSDDEHADYERVMGEFRAWQDRLDGAIRGTPPAQS